jgi:neutral ceramidase
LTRSLSARAALVVVGAYGLLLLDPRACRRPDPPRLLRSFRVSGPLRAGAAAVPVRPPLPVVRAGYGIPRAVAVRERDPLHVRALVLECGGRRVGLVLADLVLVPEGLSRAIEQRLADRGLSGVLVVATHTHSSVGGFDGRVLAQVVGTGRHRADVVGALVSAADAAVRAAERSLEPVTLRTSATTLAPWAGNRSAPGAPIDDGLTSAFFDADDGRRVATLAVVAAHPTLVERTSPILSADYPGAAMARLEDAGGIAFVLQGAAGDAALPTKGTGAVEAAGASVALGVARARVRAVAPVPLLAFAEAVVTLPPPDPQAIRPFLLRRPAAHLLVPFAPRDARVAVLAIGDVLLLGVPGEPTALASRAIASEAAAAGQVRVVGLAGGYVGYVDAPERVAAGVGESRRMWFGAELIERLREGFAVACRALGTTR